ncbi:cell division ATP-binding protein FtsE [Rickettsiales bacterium LUAb2]
MQDLFDNLIYFDNVGLRYGNHKETLSDITLSINKGDFYFLTGVSGAGKSSLLKLMDMSIKPTRGFVNMFGTEINAIKEWNLCKLRRKIGIIFQDYKLINEITIFDNIALPLKIANVDNKEIQRQVETMLNWVGLIDYKDELPLSLSGGQQQIVGIARAVITNPILILADEPTGNVDEAMSNRIVRLLEELNKQGTAIIFATHNMELVKRSNKKILSIKEGKLKITSLKPKIKKND